MEIEITKITSKGQVVIPKDLREREKIKDGEKFFIYGNGDSIILKRAKKFENSKDIEEFEKLFKSTWKIAKERGITKEDVAKEIQAYRKEKRQ